MEKQKIVFVINPISGDKDKSKLIEHIKNQTEKHHFDYQIYRTKGKNDDEQLSALIDRYQPQIAVAAGGDGTVNLVARTIKYKNICLGIIPLGSANGMATEFNIPDNFKSAFDILFHGKKRKIDTFLVNDKYTGIHLGDIGLNAKIVYRFEQEKTRGFFGYIRQFFREFHNYRPKHFTFIQDGKRFNQKAEMVIIANAKKYGTGAEINPLGKIDDGKLNICIVKPYPFWEIFTAIVLIFSSNFHKFHYVDFIETEQITILNLDNEVLQIDGEILDRPDEINIKIEKHSITVISVCP